MIIANTIKGKGVPFYENTFESHYKILSKAEFEKLNIYEIYFCKRINKKARKNKNIYLITSDLGYRAFEGFKKEFPQRFINVGVAENNMIGVATGLALTGKKFLYIQYFFYNFFFGTN